MSQLYSIRRKVDTGRGYVTLYMNLDEREARRVFRSCHYGENGEYIADPDGRDETARIMSGCPRIVERRHLTRDDVYDLCVRYGWYTRGTNQEYQAMLSAVKQNECVDAYFLYGIAKDIVEHSRMENGESIEMVMGELSMHCYSVFSIINP